MSVINIRGRLVKTSTRRWHHLDTDELARQEPGLYRDLECAITASLGPRLHAPDSSINSSVEGKSLLARFTGTPALHHFCQGRNAGRTSRLIEPRHIYGVVLLRVIGRHPDTWLTSTTPRKGVGYGIRTYRKILSGVNAVARSA